MKITEFKVTKSQFQADAFYNDGQYYDYRFDVAITVTLDDSEGVDDWGYVYRDPNGREKEISLKQFGTSYTDTRYAYFRNGQPPFTCTLYGYVKYVGDDNSVYGKPQDYPLKYELTTCPDENHPHMINLGLPSGTMWACCNVGASAPKQYGGYYAWGETQTKSIYCWVKYQYGYYEYINFEDDYSHLVNIGSDIAGTQYDAATVNWGALWRMPSSEQWKELFNNTTSVWTTQNGVNGRKFIGANGGSIFLPAAGCRSGDGRFSAGRYGDYWSSTLSERAPSHAYGLTFGDGYMGWGGSSRELGRSVRPVCNQ